MVINGVAGIVVVVVIVGGGHSLRSNYETWTAIAGSTIWCKFFSTSRSAATRTCAAARKGLSGSVQ
jgi:hypothetical protein